MVLLQSNDKLLGFLPRIGGFLRSSHAMIALFTTICFLFFLFSPNPIFSYIAIAIFFVIVIAVIGRYIVKGPESDRQQMSVTVTHSEARFMNVEPNVVFDASVKEIITEIITKGRRPLPSPAGIIDGSSSDLSAIRILSVEEAEKLTKEDMLQKSSG